MRFLISIALVAACAAPKAPTRNLGSRGMRADDHLDAAGEHTRRAGELMRWPDARPSGQFDDPSSGIWYRSWDTVREHERLASSHRVAAAGQHAEFDEACASIPAAEISTSPLQEYGIGGTPTTSGVVVYLSPLAGPADRLLARIRCHRAWMMLAEADMETCPLDLAKIKVEAHGDSKGISVEITTSEAKLVDELQRRAARDLEVAAHRRSSSH